MPNLEFSKGFFASTGKLSMHDQGRVMSFISRFNDNPANPGVSFERITNARDEGMWSARITRGLRAVIHKSGDCFTILFAGEHDEAYRWAESRRVEVHPITKITQIIERVEEVQKKVAAIEVPAEVPAKLPASQHSDEYLASLGIPLDWLPAIRMIRTEEQAIEIASRLPEDVADRLLDVVAGKIVTPPYVPGPTERPQDLPDYQRQFYVVRDASDLADILNKSMEAWTRFLHPSQRDIVEKKWSGPVKVTGSAGTGKTVVALHRARHLARQGKRVLMTSFVTTLVTNLRRSLSVLCNEQESALIATATVHSQALEIVRRVAPASSPASHEIIESLLEENAVVSGLDMPSSFYRDEWYGVIERSAITAWGDYRDVSRHGRGTPLSVRERQAVWNVFEAVQTQLTDRNMAPFAMICRRASELLDSGEVTSPFDAVLVDEVQDLGPAEIQFLARLAGAGAESLMMVGDAGQRIYPGGFSLRNLGIETRGRSRVLRINYRTTEQIRRAADLIVGSSSDDLDGGQEDRSKTRSLLTGPSPSVQGFATKEEEVNFVADKIQSLLTTGREAKEIAIFARSAASLKPFQKKLESLGIPIKPLSRDNDPASHGINVGTMHRAKGLEFKVVFAVQVNEELLPHASALSKLTDPADRDSATSLERRLLYVTLTRARDLVSISWSGSPSLFLSPLLSSSVR